MAVTSFGSLQAEDAVVIVNLDVIEKQLKALNPKILNAARAGLREGVEPIRREAASLALSDISGMKRKKTSNWDFQRVGQTVHGAYVAPVERGNKSKNDPTPERRRPNFVGVMFGKSYDPAFEHGKPGLIAFTDKWLSAVSGEFNTSTGGF